VFRLTTYVLSAVNTLAKFRQDKKKVISGFHRDVDEICALPGHYHMTPRNIAETRTSQERNVAKCLKTGSLFSGLAAL
jgi:hypothetical protein